jgi:steroid delta-isomerase
MPDADAIRATIDGYLAAFNAADRAAWLARWSPEATMEDPVGSPIRKGHEEIGAFYDDSQAMADRIRLVRTGSVRVAGHEAAFPMEVRPVLGGTEFTVDVIDAMRFDDEGRIVAMRAYWDPTAMRPVED